MCTSELVLIILSIIVDYSYMCFMCVQVNMLQRKTVARKAWAIAGIFPT